MAVSTFTALFLGYVTLASDRVTQERLAVVEGAQTEASFVQACLDYQTFVIEQFRAGLTEDQLSELAPVGALALQTGYYQSVQACPSVAEIVSVLTLPPPPLEAHTSSN